MGDFRKLFPAMAGVALMFGAASSGCSQEFLNRNGGIPTAISAPVPLVKVQIFSNTHVASRPQTTITKSADTSQTIVTRSLNSA